MGYSLKTETAGSSSATSNYPETFLKYYDEQKIIATNAGLPTPNIDALYTLWQKSTEMNK